MIVITTVVIELRSILSSKLRHHIRVNEHARSVPKHGRYELAGSRFGATKKKKNKEKLEVVENHFLSTGGASTNGTTTFYFFFIDLSSSSGSNNH
jgi:hypothetical protein